MSANHITANINQIAALCAMNWAVEILTEVELLLI
jgi:hypothetical protein